MARKTKQNIDIKIIYDTRERDLEYIKGIKLDDERLKDKTQIVATSRETCRPSNEHNVSYGDITFKYKFIDEKDSEWVQANFCIEIKKSTDQFQSIFVKKNFDRMMKEFDKAVKNDTTMYYVVTDDITDLNSKVLKIKMFGENQCKIFFDRHLKLKEELKKRDIEMIVAGNDLGWIIRRLIKKYIKDSKINYK